MNIQKSNVRTKGGLNGDAHWPNSRNNFLTEKLHMEWPTLAQEFLDGDVLTRDHVTIYQMFSSAW